MKRRILLVEDEHSVADYLTTFLEQEGFDVHHAASLAAARVLLQESFDLIMLDLNLPDGSAEQLLPAIRNLPGKIPVMIVTGASPDDDRLAASLRAGATGYVNKGARIDEIQRQLRLVLAD